MTRSLPDPWARSLDLGQDKNCFTKIPLETLCLTPPLFTTACWFELLSETGRFSVLKSMIGVFPSPWVAHASVPLNNPPYRMQSSEPAHRGRIFRVSHMNVPLINSQCDDKIVSLSLWSLGPRKFSHYLLGSLLKTHVFE